jgi:hypothetical protein
LLLILEFAYNDTKQSIIREISFYLNYRYYLIGPTRYESVSNLYIEDYIQYLLRLQEAVKDAINDAQ